MGFPLAPPPHFFSLLISSFLFSNAYIFLFSPIPSHFPVLPHLSPPPPPFLLFHRCRSVTFARQRKRPQLPSNFTLRSSTTACAPSLVEGEGSVIFNPPTPGGGGGGGHSQTEVVPMLVRAPQNCTLNGVIPGVKIYDNP